jgi:hypothetical protein
MQEKRLLQNFDTTFRGRNEVQKINGHHMVRQNLMGNPKKITVLHLEDFNFGPNAALKKTTLKNYLKIDLQKM